MTNESKKYGFTWHSLVCCISMSSQIEFPSDINPKKAHTKEKKHQRLKCTKDLSLRLQTVIISHLNESVITLSSHLSKFCINYTNYYYKTCYSVSCPNKVNLT